MKTQTAVKFGLAALVLALTGAARADEGDSVPYTGDNTAQTDAAEAGNPDSVINKDQSNRSTSIKVAATNAQVDGAETASPVSTLKLRDAVAVVNQAQVRAAEAGNPHSVDSNR